MAAATSCSRTDADIRRIVTQITDHQDRQMGQLQREMGQLQRDNGQLQRDNGQLQRDNRGKYMYLECYSQ